MHQRTRTPGRIAATVTALVALVGLAVVAGPPQVDRAGATVAAADATDAVHGTVAAAGSPVVGSLVTLYAGDRLGARSLATAVTDASGRFSLPAPTTVAGTPIHYVVARGGRPLFAPDPAVSPVHLLAPVTAPGGTALRDEVVVNELTTVASAYALSRFTVGDAISGPSPGLDIATATVAGLVDVTTGGPGPVVTNASNGSTNETLATLDTLANAVAGCTSAATLAPCTDLLAAATPPGGPAPTTTLDVLVALAHAPTTGRAEVFALAQASTTYQPALAAPPEAWVLALHVQAPQMYAPGRMAFAADGTLWTNNNWLPGTTDSSPYVVALDPVGTPVLGSPIQGGGVFGSGWGTAIDLDGSVWIANFAGSTVSKFSPQGVPLSPPNGWGNGGIDHPQGLALDRRGNVWIASNTGETPGPGNVVVFPGGDPTRAITITGSGIDHPFGIQVDDRGNAWVANAGKVGGSVTVIGPDFVPWPGSPIQAASLASPKGVALDSQGNAWIASFEDNTVVLVHPDGTVDPNSPFPLPGVLGPWGISVDGADHVWVAGFSVPGVWELCGARPGTCPPGAHTGDVLSPGAFGFRSASLQHVTAVQVDQAGNVWAANNWSQLKPPTGGDGLMAFVGLAAPVCTPLLGQPVVPSTATAQACPTFAEAPVVVPATPVVATPSFTG